MKNFVTILSAVVIALGIGAAGFFVQKGLKAIYADNRHVSVKGLAERDVEADVAIWSISFSSANKELSVARSEVDSMDQKIRKFLTDSEIEPEAVRIESLSAYEGSELSSRDEDGTENYEKVYTISERLIVRTNKVTAVEQAAQKTAALIDQGVVMNASVRYLFTKLNDVKPEMIAEATRKAREAADQFAKDSGNKVGKMFSASQGWFNIVPRDGSDSDNEENFVNKKVRVVTETSFGLVD